MQSSSYANVSLTIFTYLAIMTHPTLYIADCAEPFFTAAASPGTINWSKIPFSALERNGELDPSRRRRILDTMGPYLDRLAADGYTAVTLDDLAHIAYFPEYPEPLRAKIKSWQPLYEAVIEMARQKKLQVFITTDILFCPQPFKARLMLDPAGEAAAIITRAARDLFKRFPTIAGIVARIGEADGCDVNDPFASRIFLKTPRQCNQFLKAVLPVFESFNRSLILRTWTLGAYELGDLIWNAETQERVLESIESDALIISRKPGDADFFRGLKINPLFYETPVRQIVELQARREYEGFGTFPCFAGSEYERIHDALLGCKHYAGVMIWHQTGGWSSWQTSYMSKTVPWTAINSFVALRVFRYDEPPLDSARVYVRKHLPGSDPDPILRLLALSEQTINNGWYIRQFTDANLYFRRLRIPVLPWVFWDTIIVNHAVRDLLRRSVPDPRSALAQSRAALLQAHDLLGYAHTANVDTTGIMLLLDTLDILHMIREYFLGPDDQSWELRLQAAAALYRSRQPGGFRIEVDLSPSRTPGIFVEWFLHLFVRTVPAYRPGEKSALVPLSGLIYPLVRMALRNRLPSFMERQAMGMQFFFR